MDFPQCGVPFPGNASTTDAPSSATPSSYLCPVSRHTRGQENAAGNHSLDEDRVDTTPAPVENTAAQGQTQDLQYIDMGYYNMANDRSSSLEHRDHTINDYAGVALDVPTQAQAAPPVPEIDIFNDPALHAAEGPTRVFLDELPNQGLVPNVQVNEVLRQLAILYLREPNAQVAMIRMEPRQAHGITVHITVELR